MLTYHIAKFLLAYSLFRLKRYVTPLMVAGIIPSQLGIVLHEPDLHVLQCATMWLVLDLLGFTALDYFKFQNAAIEISFIHRHLSYCRKRLLLVWKMCQMLKQGI